jgi:hypothetical protein
MTFLIPAYRVRIKREELRNLVPRPGLSGR